MSVWHVHWRAYFSWRLVGCSLTSLVSTNTAISKTNFSWRRWMLNHAAMGVSPLETGGKCPYASEIIPRNGTIWNYLELCRFPIRPICNVYFTSAMLSVYGSQSSPRGLCGLFDKGLKPPIGPTASHLTPDRWIRSSTTQLWSGNRLLSSTESSSMEHAH